MSRLEDELRNAYRREQPPAGFEARLMARLGERRESLWRRILGALSTPVWRVACAGALSLVVVAGLHYQQEQRERVRGEEAKRQLLVALHVTGDKLHSIHGKVRALGAEESTE